MRIPAKYKEAIMEIYHDSEGYWIYMNSGWCIDFSGEKVHTINAGKTQKEVREFLEDYKIEPDEDFYVDVAY